MSDDLVKRLETRAKAAREEDNMTATCDAQHFEEAAARIRELEARDKRKKNEALREAEKAMRDECTPPEGTYDMRIEGDIARAEQATIEVASAAILARIDADDSGEGE